MVDVTSLLDNPTINKRSQELCAMTPSQLLEAYEAGELTDEKEIKLAQRLARALEREISRYENRAQAQAQAADEETDISWRTFPSRHAPWLLWLIPIGVIATVLILHPQIIHSFTLIFR